MDTIILRDIPAIVGASIALVAFIKGVYEYTKTNTMKRAEYFLLLHKELMDVVVASHIASALEYDHKALQNLSYDDKFKFLGYFEKIALMMNSGLVREQVVHYMFGYYAVKCYDNEEFWRDLDRKSYFWSLFCAFAARMKELDAKASKGQISTSQIRF